MLNLSFFLFQATDVATDAATTAAPSQNIIDIIASGGIMGIANVTITLILSIIALYIFIERYLTIKQAGKLDENFINNIRRRRSIWQY
ncbi:MAG: hypothetical protein U0T36_12885 [Saprospiraceae bacterium]